MPDRPTDSEMLDWLDRRNVETGYTDDEPGERGVWVIHGPINDREWSLEGTGATLRAAIAAAMSASSHPENPNE